VRPRIAGRPRRRYRRRTLRVMVEYVSDAGLAADPATTLGAGGIFIETESPLPEGGMLKMRFALPGGGTVHELAGRVVWRRRPSDPGRHSPGMGIEFTDRGAASQLARELETLD
jgi:type IV pilus assembly protein PilZ